ncbi:uncharacterized protein LOC135536145 [Oncorhynchus masou masou]|uniref:uncharacterized protein LOC135536145 n=1 Tax=Oncorhynchus masou masou TaxID=90313 RepID=UPI0031837317
MDHHWRLRAMDHHWRFTQEDWSMDQAQDSTGWGETQEDWSVEQVLEDQAVVEHWRSGAYPWHHSSRLNAHFRPAPPERRQRTNRAVGEHWRSAAFHLHLSSWLNAHFCLARAERRHRTNRAVTAHWRHSGQSRRRIACAETAHRRPSTLSCHNLPWLDAHSSVALAESWHIAHRAMRANGRHRALYRQMRCPNCTTLLTVSTGSWLRSVP